MASESTPKYQIFDMETRPVKAWNMVRELSTYFALKLQPKKFDVELCDSLISSYFFRVKILEKDKDSSLSDKQYSLLYNIYNKYHIEVLYKNIYDHVKFVCVNVKKIENSELVYTESHEPVQDYYFELQDKSILTAEEFELKYGKYILHSKYKKLSTSTNDDFD